MGDGGQAELTEAAAQILAWKRADARDAIGAAYTARLHVGGETETFDELVVPR